MTESYFKKIKINPNGGTITAKKTEKTPSPTDPELSLLDSLNVVESIVTRKAVHRWRTDAKDLVQEIFLRLLNWHTNHEDKSSKMSSEDRNAFAAQTSFNELNRHLKKQSRLAEVPVDEASELSVDEQVEGQTEAEVTSLTSAVWQEICSQSLRRRRALLFHASKLIPYLLEKDISHEDIAAVLEVSAEFWKAVYPQLPLPDDELAELLKNEDGNAHCGMTAGAIKKARHEVRQILRRITDK